MLPPRSSPLMAELRKPPGRSAPPTTSGDGPVEVGGHSRRPPPRSTNRDIRHVDGRIVGADGFGDVSRLLNGEPGRLPRRAALAITGDDSASGLPALGGDTVAGQTPSEAKRPGQGSYVSFLSRAMGGPASSWSGSRCLRPEYGFNAQSGTPPALVRGRRTFLCPDC